MLNVPPATKNANHPILREEVEAAVKSLKKGKSAGVDNISAELLQQGREAMVNALLIICNKIWRTGELPIYSYARATAPSVLLATQAKAC